MYEFPFFNNLMDSNENNLYPFINLGLNENFFVFSNRKSILFDHVNKHMVQHYLDTLDYSIKYMTFGSFNLIPLDLGTKDVEVLICDTRV